MPALPTTTASLTPCSTIYDFDGELGQLDASAALGAPPDGAAAVDPSRVIAVGRKDYVLRSVHPQARTAPHRLLPASAAGRCWACEGMRCAGGRSCWRGCPGGQRSSSHSAPLSHLQFGMQWNVTWGRVSHLSELSVQPVGGPAGAYAALPPQGAADAGGLQEDMSLLVAPDFTLRCVHPSE